MNIYLGNLSIEELEKQHEFALSEEQRTFLESMRQDKANVKNTNKFHIFDVPRVIACGNMDIAQKVYNVLKQYSIKGHIEIGIDK